MTINGPYHDEARARKIARVSAYTFGRAYAMVRGSDDAYYVLPAALASEPVYRVTPEEARA